MTLSTLSRQFRNIFAPGLFSKLILDDVKLKELEAGLLTEPRWVSSWKDFYIYPILWNFVDDKRIFTTCKWESKTILMLL